ncbi:CitMHS family transporter [Glaciimonas immobilis]|uniref:CitMHS family citrate-Mg2+:H+ or citrate-Ca2+:H+ symporter n=1 Tax=Glaciimonas immobilis TaxID=728004 RepID=A0A840RQL6_9BURK|nr:citrate:proton symporter [Glaciimonas immobilis]KAF3997137.1 citrate transporter [Glaciimonas immobilis]MBB5200003.1 CitMHS family citrate-Mg2+:H+ or citrate-Ca2+:H+ symporter [Glaciimonas immobilis]
MLTLIGLFTLVTLVLLLLWRKVSPIIGLVLIPLTGAVLAGFSIPEIGAFYSAGLTKVMPVATMFIFAITFFGVMQDAGLFRPLIRGMVTLTRGNVVTVAIGTAILGMLAHLDGAGATTFLMTIPALLPLYKKLKMNPYLMLMLLATGAGIFNMLPWAGPLGRAAAVTGIEVTSLWQPLIPIQIIGAVLLIAMASIFGLAEKRRIAMAQGGQINLNDGANTAIVVDAAEDAEADIAHQMSAQEEALLRPKLIWVNTAIFAAVLASLIGGILPSAYIFMIGLSIALIINYPTVDEQAKRISAHAQSAMMMGGIILAAGSFLGIMDGSGMLRAIANDLVNILPTATVPHLHLILGFFGFPMELLLSTDAYYFGLLPVVVQIVSEHGVPAANIVHALTIGNVLGTFISPFSPALWMALGLAQLEIGAYIRYAFFWMWGFSLLLFGAALMLDLM